MIGLRLTKLQTVALIGLQTILFGLPLMASATCCLCTHPQVKNGKFCIQNVTDCSTLNSSSNKELAGVACTPDTSANACKKVPAGQCVANPYDELSFKLANVPGYASASTGSTTPQPAPLVFTPNVPISGLTLYAPYKDNTDLIVPMLAQYIQAMQKLLIGIGLVAAAIMVMYGGFLYIVSGTGAKVKEGKQVIIDALIGVVIILSSAVILSNLNPNTANLSALRITAITPQPFEFITASQYGDAARSSGIAGISGELPTPAQVLDYAKTKATDAGIDPCIVYAIIMAESRGQVIIGHDENQYFGPNAGLIQSRLDFMRSRKFASGKDFDPSVPAMPADCNAGNKVECQTDAAYPMDYKSNADQQMKNDDVFIGSSPPDYGLDWRFSHGIGASMGTIFPNSARCADGSRGYTVGGTCYNVAQLVTKEGAVASTLSQPTIKPGADPKTVFCAYGGRTLANCDAIKQLVDNKMSFFNNCPYR